MRAKLYWAKVTTPDGNSSPQKHIKKTTSDTVNIAKAIHTHSPVSPLFKKK